MPNKEITKQVRDDRGADRKAVFSNENMEITITINGKQHSIHEGMSLSSLLRLLDVNSDRVAIEYNMEIINENDFNDTVMKNNDTLEIITFVGGGV